MANKAYKMEDDEELEKLFSQLDRETAKLIDNQHTPTKKTTSKKKTAKKTPTKKTTVKKSDTKKK